MKCLTFWHSCYIRFFKKSFKKQSILWLKMYLISYNNKYSSFLWRTSILFLERSIICHLKCWAYRNFKNIGIFKKKCISHIYSVRLVSLCANKFKVTKIVIDNLTCPQNICTMLYHFYIGIHTIKNLQNFEIYWFYGEASLAFINQLHFYTILFSFHILILYVPIIYLI